MSQSWLSIAQAGLYAAVAPLSVGVVRWLKARMQGRRGADPLQMYRDLWKLLRIRPNVPGSASGVFQVAPPVVFTCFLLLGYALPMVAVPPGKGMDLLLVVGLLGLAKFVTTLAAFDAGSPFGPMSGGRQWFVHVLAEPALLVAIYVFAMIRSTTNLPLLATTAGGGSWLVAEPTIPLAIGALGFVLLAEIGRLPFDNPGTHLELTMIEEGTKLEYSGRALALVMWADAMKLTFGLSLVAFLALPTGPVDLDSPLPLLVGLGGYLAKLGVLLLLLAWWETRRGKLRLRAIVTPLLLATGVLLFTLVTLVVSYVQPGT
jgi:formate hydrogenlyase subunit 4